MDDPVHGRRAAIYVNERKPLPPSFYWGLTAALALHVGVGYYLIQQHFAQTLPEVPPPVSAPPTILTMEAPPKPDKPVPPNVVRVHDPVQVRKDADPIPLVPQPKVINAPATAAPPVIVDQPVPEVKPLPPIPGPMVGVRWSRFPDGAALAEYYPQKGIDVEIDGQATVQCAVLDTSGRVSCVVISETPGGYGFGAATVRMVEDKGRVDTTQGGVTKGAILRQTVAWKLN